MTQITPHAFLNALARLDRAHPQARRHADALADAVIDPREADAERIWSVLWDKPLYANTRVATADRWVAALRDNMTGAWRRWGADASLFRIERVGPGIRRDAFRVEGAEARDLVSRRRVALHRLRRIQGAAGALRARAAVSPRPFADLAAADLDEIVPRLAAEFGEGWGPITILHALTDMGLAVKPDLHLVRAVVALGLCAPPANGRMPSLAEALAINRVIRTLLLRLDGAFTPAGLRRLDKILMELSMRGALPDAEAPGPESAPLMDCKSGCDGVAERAHASS